MCCRAMGMVTRVCCNSPHHHVAPLSVLLRRMCQLSTPSLVRQVPTCRQKYGGVDRPATPSLVHQSPTDTHCGGVRRPSLVPQWHAGHQQCRACLHTSAPHHVSWREFVLSIRVFGGGVKSLYGDMKLMKACISQYGGLKIDKLAPRVIGDGKTTLLYPRKDLQFMYRVRWDLCMDAASLCCLQLVEARGQEDAASLGALHDSCCGVHRSPLGVSHAPLPNVVWHETTCPLGCCILKSF